MPIWSILSDGSGKKRLEIMVSRSSGTEPAAVSIELFAADVARRREALGNIELPRNSGNRRTTSKRALLQAIEDLGGRW
jgi:hypothetical protein